MRQAEIDTIDSKLTSPACQKQQDENMKTAVEVIIALLPIAALFVGFLVLRLSAFMASFYAWVLELVVVLAYYQQPPLKIAEASLWGVITIWSGFLVLCTGQIFGQAASGAGPFGEAPEIETAPIAIL